MTYINTIFSILGSLGLFLYGMKIMSDGIQKAAGDRLQKAINFMTGNRLASILTGVVVTALVQSSSATTVMVVSFVNAGLLTLSQSIGVIMGANIGTTITAWIVSLIGFKLNIVAFALPAIGLGFLLMMVVKWGRKDLGETILGFGLLFLGLNYLTKSMPDIGPEQISFIASVSHLGFITVIIGVLAGIAITVLVHSSSASTAIIITLAFKGMIEFDLAAAMIFGANIGTTIDALLASIGTKANAKRAALVHILFNVIGTLWAIFAIAPLIWLVDAIVPGEPVGSHITVHIAMLHTLFNMINTVIFFPFIPMMSKIVCKLIKDDAVSNLPVRYKLSYASGSIQDAPELNILRAEKEIRDMAGLVETMFDRFRTALATMDGDDILHMVEELKQREDYADQMREEISRFLVECARQQLNKKSEYNVTQLMRIVSDLEEMTDDCFSLSITLQRSVVKKQHFDQKELDALAPYVQLVRDFLTIVHKNLGQHITPAQVEEASRLEDQIDKWRSKLKKTARKRLEAGADVKTELLFIDLIRRIEKLGDYSYSITEAMGSML